MTRRERQQIERDCLDPQVQKHLSAIQAELAAQPGTVLDSLSCPVCMKSWKAPSVEVAATRYAKHFSLKHEQPT